MNKNNNSFIYKIRKYANKKFLYATELMSKDDKECYDIIKKLQNIT